MACANSIAMKLRVQLLAFLGVCAGVAGLPAQTLFTWSSTATTPTFEDPANWGGAVPTPGSALVFGPSTYTTVQLNASIDVAGLTFNSGTSSVGYGLTSLNAAVLGIGSGGIVLSNTGSGSVGFAAGLGLKLTASQTWSVGAAWNLDVLGNISGPFGLTKAGDGSLLLGGTNSFSGGLSVKGGYVQAMTAGALGAATNNVVINATGTSWAALELGGTQHTIGALTFGGAGGAAGSSNSLGMSFGGRLTLGGDVTFDSSGRSSGAFVSGGTIALGGNRRFHVTDSPYAWSELLIASPIEGTGASLTKTGAGILELAGMNTYTGGTIVNEGVLRAMGAGALPAGGDVTVNSLGGTAILDVSGEVQTVGTLTLGGSTAAAFSRNQVTISGGAALTIANALNFVGTNGPASARVEGGLLNLGATGSRTFDIANSVNADVDVTIASQITGAAGLTKSGAGTLLLSGNNTFSGGTTVAAGTLVIGRDSAKTALGQLLSGAAGVGTLTLSPGSALIARSDTGAEVLEVANAVSLGTNVTLGASEKDGGAFLDFSGVVTTTATATSINLAPEAGVSFSGSIAGPSAGSSLTFRSPAGPTGATLLSGTTAATITGITADHAGVLFAHANAVPATLTTIAATNNGYIGVAATDTGSVPSPATVLGRITDRAGFSGTFGLDTYSDTLPPRIFTDDLDLTGFGPGFTLGSKTVAVASGAITPPSTGYAFGNGGGFLVIRSNLADVGGSKSVSVNSATAAEGGALMTVFQGNNTFTGSFSVANSGAVLDAATALPAGRTITLGANGYLGYTEAFTGVPNFAALLPRVTGTATSVLGFDSRQWIATALATGQPDFYAARFVSETLDLSNYAPVYLGSATRAIIAGPVIAPGVSRTLSLIGVGEGELEVRSKLTAGNVNQVVVGASGNPLGFGSVMLSGQNTYAGGTTLHAGTLSLGASSLLAGTSIASGPLGLGPLTIANSGNFPTLMASSEGITTLHNALVVGGPLRLGSGGGGNWTSYDRLVLAGTISDLTPAQPGKLHIQGDTVLSGANTFSGGVAVQFGELVIGQNNALGTGTLTLEPVPLGGGGGWARISTGDLPRTIANNVFINAPHSGYVEVGGQGSLTITGIVTLGVNPVFAPQQHMLYLSGPVTGAAMLRSAGYNPIVLNNATATPNNYTGGTLSEYGSIIFGTANAIPATGLLMSHWGGYIGVAAPALLGPFLDRFDRQDSDGAIGFDTLGTGVTNEFSGAIDLTGFDFSARLGSATRAILKGTITPQDTSYNFGGGGGLLEVNSTLGDIVGAVASPRSVSVTSPDTAPLTVRLTGAATYTGGTSVYGSALVFKAGSMPATGSFTATSDGYIGTEDLAVGLAPQSFIDRFNPSMTDGIIGFDAATGTHPVSGAISLTRFISATDPRIFLGTTTAATISGTIALPANQTAYRFTGYKGGQLTVGSLLDGARSVEIGDAYVPATYRSPVDVQKPLSTVILSGANSYTGGTTLFGGALGIGSGASPLGTAGLTIAGMLYIPGDYDAMPLLFASGAGRTLTNAVSLLSNLEVGGGAGESNTLGLGGNISGVYSLFKTGPSTLVLSGANTFSGGTSVREGNVTFAHLNAAGAGMLEFAGSATASATFSETAIVNGISGDRGLIIVAAGKSLTVNQQSSAAYAGQFALGVGSGLNFAGPSAVTPTTLWLNGTSSYATGTTKIQPGVTVVAGNSAAFGASTNAVTLDGGGLAVSAGVTLTNPLIVNSGTLAGAGTFQPPGGSIAIKSGVVVSPGGPHEPGTLTFAGTDLSLQSGGMYLWHIADASPTGTWDRINVGGTVTISALTAPFTFKIVPAGSLDLVGAVANFNPYVAQSWPVLTASLISGSIDTGFTFDTGYVTSLIAGGTFSFSLNGTNTTLMLNFTPVPEPSTYAMLGLGAAVLAFVHRRRRR